MGNKVKQPKQIRPEVKYKQMYDSLSIYVKTLEQRILNLELFLQIDTKLNKKESVTLIGSAYLKNQQHILFGTTTLNAVNTYFGTTVSDWLIKNRKYESIRIKYIFFWLLIYKYKIDDYKDIQYIVSKYNYYFERTNMYHIKDVYENCLVSKTDKDIETLRMYNEIFNKL